jgi:hypothetical protein
MANKDFKVKNKLVIAGLSQNSGVLIAENKEVDSYTNVPTQYGGTGTTVSPAAGEIIYSSAGTAYAPTSLLSLDVKGSSFTDNAPINPVVGQLWVESDSSADSFDPNLIRRQTFTATTSQTTFNTTFGFIQGYEQVYYNGVLILRGVDYTTPTTSSVVLSEGAFNGDIVEILTITNLNAIDTYTQAEVNTLINNSESEILGIIADNDILNYMGAI